jgi:hypothetical protein
VREARNLHEQKKRDQELLQQQKAAVIRAREESKLTKARGIDARCQARAEARLLRERQRADEAAERAARQAARKAAKQLRQATKTSQKGKKRRFKACKKSTPKKSSLEIVVVVRSHLLAHQAHHQFDRDVGATLSCQPDMSRQNIAILLLDRNNKISRNNSYLVRLYSLIFVVVLVGRSGHTAVPGTPPSGTVRSIDLITIEHDYRTWPH